MTKSFESKDLDSPRHMAEMLLAHIIGCDRLWVDDHVLSSWYDGK